MTRVVWKYPVPIGGLAFVLAPSAAQVRLAAIDPATGWPAVWIELDTAAPKVERRFFARGTGQTIEGDGGYPSPIHVGSMIDGGDVWHIYEQRA